MGGLGDNEGDKPGELSRRQFASAAFKTGVATSAAIWVAPQLSTVALAQTTAGSPPPSTTRSEGAGPSEPAEPGAPGGAAAAAPSAGGIGRPEAGAPGAGGELALTGSDVRTLAATGGAAVLTGSALVAAERLSGRRRARPATAKEGPSDEAAR